MERKCLKLGHPGQGIRERFWIKIPVTRDFVELKIYEVL